MSYTTLTSQYATTAITTAPPEKLLTMLLDRLVLDLHRGKEALEEGKNDKARENLTHAQDIFAEAISTLDTSVWDDGPGLLSLYTFLLTRTIEANNNADAGAVAQIIELITPVVEAFKQAADQVLAQAPPQPVQVVVTLASGEVQAWTHVLDQFERQVARAEAMLTGPPPTTAEPLGWDVPQGLGPLPVELRQRAADLLERTHAAQEALREAVQGARDDLARLPVRSTATGAGPVYLDTTA